MNIQSYLQTRYEIERLKLLVCDSDEKKMRSLQRKPELFLSEQSANKRKTIELNLALSNEKLENFDEYSRFYKKYLAKINI